VISIPATIIAALDPGPQRATQLGSIDLVVWAFIAPTQAIAAWLDARLRRLLRACDFAGRRGGEDLGGKAGGELTRSAEHSDAYAGFVPRYRPLPGKSTPRLKSLRSCDRSLGSGS